MISDKKKFIYIHIPKCAGTTITRFLLNHSEDIDSGVRGKSHDSIMVRRPDKASHKHFGLGYMHASALEIKDFLGDEKFEDYYKFSIIRNTYDRLISLYFWAHGSDAEFSFKRFKNLINVHQDDRRIIVDYKMGKIKQNRGCVSQNFFICNHHVESEDLMLDKVVRLDNLEDGMAQVCKDIDIKFKPLNIKMNKSKHKHYSYYYNQDLIDLIDEIYGNEILKFNFKFKDETGRGLRGMLND